MTYDILKEMLRSINQPGTLTRTAQVLRIAEEEILRWSENLNSARVTRWGGVISTPGNILNFPYQNKKLSLQFRTFENSNKILIKP